MTLNAREAMQALLDGKTICHGGYRTNLTDRGLTRECGGCVWSVFTLEGSEIVEEYPLTFEEALRAMLDGKVVESGDALRSRYRFNKESSCIEWRNKRYTAEKWTVGGVDISEQRAKWKVVE